MVEGKEQLNNNVKLPISVAVARFAVQQPTSRFFLPEQQGSGGLMDE